MAPHFWLPFLFIFSSQIATARSEIIAMQNTGFPVFNEPGDALASETSEQHVNMLRRVIDLFLIDSNRLSDEQIGVFDDVLCRLIDRAESRTLAQISKCLASADGAPLDLIQRLARYEHISVAGPVLKNSKSLTTEQLLDIAKSKGQQHLLAIAHRAQIAPEITDVLLDRGNRAVIHRVALNAGAQISDNGFRAVIKAAEFDTVLAEKTIARLDIPPAIAALLAHEASQPA